jgi:predicted nuclease of restriction endonuclease-like (RecB) superfamily
VRSAPAQSVIESLSYTHIEQLVALDVKPKREFYQAECIKGSWSVRELKRQINSLLYERSALSTDKQGLAELTESTVGKQAAGLSVRDPYIFDFLGLTPAEVMSESHLEDQLLNNLQQFLLELGRGFCFEARQQRILIGDKYYFVDLVFYHRILKCHVLVELKLEEFSHENIGQLNTYVSWYDKNVRTDSDNPPVGILLCTEKDHALVEYALAGMDNDLFVSKYQLELPSKEVLQQQLEAERHRLQDNEPPNE